MYNKNRNTYNANGIRTSKTVDGVLHTYQLDGTKILKETWGDCTLIPLYDVVPSYYWDVTPQFNSVMNNILSMSSSIKKVAQDVD